MIKEFLKHNLTIKNIVEIISIFLPIIASFLPMDLFLVIGTTICILLVINFRQFKHSFMYKGNFLFYIYAFYMGILALVNNNLLGLIAVFFLLLILIYISFLRTIITKIKFDVLMLVIALGSLFSLYYSTVNFYTTSTYSLYEFFMKLILIPYTFVVGIAEGVRSSSTFIQPNFYGHLSAFIALISLYYILSSLKKIYHKYYLYLLKLVFFVVILGVNLFALNLTQSRSAYIGFIVGALVLVLIFDTRLFIGLSITLGFLITTKYDRLLSLFPRLDTVSLDSVGRINLYKSAIEAIKDSWLFGKGFYTYPLVYQKYSTQYEIHTHNIFLELILDSGFVGISIVAAYYSTYIKRPFKDWVHRNKEYLPLVCGVLALEVANGLTDAVLIFPQSFILLSIVLLSLELNEKLE